MQFADFVPEGARAHIQRTLEGGGHSWRGINSFITEYTSTGESKDALTALIRERDLMIRFATDLRMKDAYDELQKVFTENQQYADFLSAAWGADMDYKPYRERIKAANRLKPKIAAAARELAGLLVDLTHTHVMPPDELFSIRALLDATDNHEMRGHNFYIWRSVREFITGRKFENISAESEDYSAEKITHPKKIIIVKEGDEINESVENDPDTLIICIRSFASDGAEMKIDPEIQARHMLGYAWEKAPHLPAFLEVVARVAEAWAPTDYGAVGAAVSNRQHNNRNEYVRAFASILKEDKKIEAKGPIVAAIAATTDVVLNWSGTTSPDNVRKALEDSA